MKTGRSDYLPGSRFSIPDTTRQVDSTYDSDSKMLQDLIQRGISPAKVIKLDLTKAGQLSIDDPGFHFCLYAHDGSPTKAVDTKGLVNVVINSKFDNGDNPFPAKHGRGYSGPFQGLYLTWPAQAGIYADFVIYKAYMQPWIDGEAPT